jgi:hypothetical protein
VRDLRIYDANGAEIGYVLAGDPPIAPVYKPAVMLPIATVDTRTERTSGFEADLGEPTLVDRLRIDGIDPPFLKRLKLEGSGDRERWTLLVAEGTLFNLPDEKLLQTELQFPAGTFRYLRVTWDDRQARIARMPAAAAGQVPAAAPRDRRWSRRWSSSAVRAGAGPLPDWRPPISITALDLDVRAGTRCVRQSVSVAVERAQLPGLLGRTTLRRVVRDGLPLRHCGRRSMRRPTRKSVVVDDGDNPALDLQGWPPPRRTAVDLSGSARRRTDCGALRQLAASRISRKPLSRHPDQTVARRGGRGAPARRTARAPCPRCRPSARRWTPPSSAIRAVPAGNAAVALGPTSACSRTAPGVSRLLVARGRCGGPPDSGTSSSRSEPLSPDVVLEKQAKLPASLGPAKAGRTVYRVTYPMAGLPESRLVLSTPARVFDRGVSVVEEREPDQQRRRDPWTDMIAATRWIHADQNRAATPLTIPVRPLHGTDLFVLVDEGDNAPLALEAGRLLLPAYRIRFFRDAVSPLRVAYGRTDLDRPKYDLALLAPQVLGTPAADVVLDAEPKAADVTTTAGLVSPRLFWGALVMAIVVLLGLIARLLKKPAA